ncbi:MAG: VanZ family protein [Nitriliruptoraceae bacterium]|nr:VanZ family protein [Nitriliruptoraceae bacterium]
MGRFEAAFAATPWALPGLVVLAVLGVVLAGPVGRWTDRGPLVGFLLAVGLGAPLVITLTPSAGILDTGIGSAGARFCALLPPTALLATPTDVLNGAMLIPLGIAVASIPQGRRFLALLAVAVALPPLIEALQYLGHPLLGRSCQAGDVVHNWIGLAVGLVVGRTVRWVLAAGR